MDGRKVKGNKIKTQYDYVYGHLFMVILNFFYCMFRKWFLLFLLINPVYLLPVPGPRPEPVLPTVAQGIIFALTFFKVSFKRQF